MVDSNKDKYYERNDRISAIELHFKNEIED